MWLLMPVISVISLFGWDYGFFNRYFTLFVWISQWWISLCFQFVSKNGSLPDVSTAPPLSSFNANCHIVLLSLFQRQMGFEHPITEAGITHQEQFLLSFITHSCLALIPNTLASDTRTVEKQHELWLYGYVVGCHKNAAVDVWVKSF